MAMASQSAEDADVCNACGRQPIAFVCPAAECVGRLMCDQCDRDWHAEPSRAQHQVMAHLPARNSISWTCPGCTFANRWDASPLPSPSLASPSPSPLFCLDCDLCGVSCADNVSLRGAWLPAAAAAGGQSRAAAALSRSLRLAGEMAALIRQQDGRIAELTRRLAEARQRLLLAPPTPPTLLQKEAKKAKKTRGSSAPLFRRLSGLFSRQRRRSSGGVVQAAEAVAALVDDDGCDASVDYVGDTDDDCDEGENAAMTKATGTARFDKGTGKRDKFY